MVHLTDTEKEAFNPLTGGREIDYFARLEIDETKNAEFGANTYHPELNRTSGMYEDMIFTDYTTLDYATFEYKGFALDGSKATPLRADEDIDTKIGYVSDTISDENGDYEIQNRSFWAALSPARNIKGVTIYWGYFIPDTFYIITRDSSSNVIDQTEITENRSAITAYSKAIENAHTVLVIVGKSALPYQRLRMAGFRTSPTLFYNKENTEGMRVQELIDPYGERVPNHTLSVTADNMDRQYDIFDPTGISANFRERAKMILLIDARMPGGRSIRVDMGPYYIRAPKLTGNISKLEIEAVSKIGVLTDTPYYPRTNWEAGGAQISFADILLQSQPDYETNESVWDGYWPSSFSSATTQWYIPRMTYAELLQKVAQATNTITSTDRQGKIVFQELPSQVMQHVDENDYAADNGFSISDEDIINTVIIEYSQYAREEDWNEIARVDYDGAVSSITKYGDHSYVSGTGGDMHILHQYGSGHSYEVANGQLILKSRLIMETKKQEKVTNRKAGETEYIYRVTGNPFITSKAQAQAIAQHLLNLKAVKRRNVEIVFRGYPYIEMCDILTFGNGGMTTPPFYVTENTLKLSGGGMSGTLKAKEL